MVIGTALLITLTLCTTLVFSKPFDRRHCNTTAGTSKLDYSHCFTALDMLSLGYPDRNKMPRDEQYYLVHDLTKTSYHYPILCPHSTPILTCEVVMDFVQHNPDYGDESRLPSIENFLEDGTSLIEKCEREGHFAGGMVEAWIGSTSRYLTLNVLDFQSTGGRGNQTREEEPLPILK